MSIHYQLDEALKRARQKIIAAYNQALRYFLSWQRPPTLVEQIQKNLGRLKPLHFAAAYSSNMSIYTIDPLYHGVEEYTRKLEYASRVLEYSQDAPVSLFNSVPRTMHVTDFFLGDNRCYLNTVEAGLAFKEAANNFLSWYALRETANDSITHTRNIRIFQHVAANLLTLTEQLRHLRS